MTVMPDSNSSWHLERRQRLFLALVAIQITCLLVADMVGVKIFRFQLGDGDMFPMRIEHTAGMIPFPVTFLVTDLVNEFYGKRAARFVAKLAFGMALLAFVLVSIARVLPIHEGYDNTATDQSFENIFGNSSLMTMCSIVAFFLGSLLDIAIFGFFKRITKGRMVWLRATGSTVISQLFDSFVITTLYFVVARALSGHEIATFGFIVEFALTGYVLKFVIAVALTPAMYAGRALIRRGFKLEPLSGDDPEAVEVPA